MNGYLLLRPVPRRHRLPTLTRTAFGCRPSPATGPGWRALGRAWHVGRQRLGQVPRMRPDPGFEIPDEFLQPEDCCPLLGGCQLQLSDKCLQGGNHGWHQSPERAQEPSSRLDAVNGYRKPPASEAIIHCLAL